MKKIVYLAPLALLGLGAKVGADEAPTHISNALRVYEQKSQNAHIDQVTHISRLDDGLIDDDSSVGKGQDQVSVNSQASELSNRRDQAEANSRTSMPSMQTMTINPTQPSYEVNEEKTTVNDQIKTSDTIMHVEYVNPDGTQAYGLDGNTKLDGYDITISTKTLGNYHYKVPAGFSLVGDGNYAIREHTHNNFEAVISESADAGGNNEAKSIYHNPTELKKVVDDVASIVTPKVAQALGATNGNTYFDQNTNMLSFWDGGDETTHSSIWGAARNAAPLHVYIGNHMFNPVHLQGNWSWQDYNSGKLSDAYGISDNKMTQLWHDFHLIDDINGGLEFTYKGLVDDHYADLDNLSKGVTIDNDTIKVAIVPTNKNYVWVNYVNSQGQKFKDNQGKDLTGYEINLDKAQSGNYNTPTGYLLTSNKGYTISETNERYNFQDNNGQQIKTVNGVKVINVVLQPAIEYVNPNISKIKQYANLSTIGINGNNIKKNKSIQFNFGYNHNLAKDTISIDYDNYTNKNTYFDNDVSFTDLLGYHQINNKLLSLKL